MKIEIKNATNLCTYWKKRKLTAASIVEKLSFKTDMKFASSGFSLEAKSLKPKTKTYVYIMTCLTANSDHDDFSSRSDELLF